MIVLCGTLPCIDACPDRQECMKAMAKAPTKVKRGIDIGDHYVVEDGKKLVPNPDKERNIPVPAKYARKKKRTWKSAK